MRRLAGIALVTIGLGAALACTTKAGPVTDGDAGFDLDSGLDFDTGSTDGTVDAAEEAPSEASPRDATFEAGPEASAEAAPPVEASVDAAAFDAAIEAGVDASLGGPEAGPEAGAEAGAEAGLDAAADVRPSCVNPATDCPSTATLCKVPVCAAGECAVQIATAGATCNDQGGDVCDGFGNCVSSCLDHMLDGTETDVDCGGAYCDAEQYTCADGKHCLVGADCRDKVCTGNVCQAATCSDGVRNGTETGVDCGGDCTSLPVPQACPSGDTCFTATDCLSGECNSSDTCVQRQNGEQCYNGAQSCASGFCANVSNGLGSICCDTACSGTCEYCGGGTGLTYGKCGQVPAGPAPSGQCSSSGTCGNDGNCTAAGTCEQEPTTHSCTPTCVGTTYTAGGFCTGTGTCGGAVSDCTPYACSTFVPACNTSCSQPSDCAPGHTCTAGTCQ